MKAFPLYLSASLFALSLVLSASCSQDDQTATGQGSGSKAKDSLGANLAQSLSIDTDLTQDQVNYIVQKGYEKSSETATGLLLIDDEFKVDLETMTAGVVGALDDAEAGVSADELEKVLRIACQSMASSIDDAADASGITLETSDMSGILQEMNKGALSELSNEQSLKLASSLTNGLVKGAMATGDIPNESIETFSSSLLADMIATMASREDLSTTGLAEFIGNASQGLMVGFGDSVPAAYFDDVAKGLSSGAIAGAQGIESFDAVQLKVLVESCSQGIITASGSIQGFTSEYYDELATATAAGVMAGLGDWKNFDASLYEDIATATTTGLMEGAGEIKNLPPGFFATIAEAGTAGIMSGAGEIPNFNADLYAVLAQGSSEGVLKGASVVPNFDSALLDDLAQASSAGVMQGAGEIPGFDPALFDNLAQSSVAGAVAGAGNFSNINSSVITAIGNAATQGAVDGVPPSISPATITAAAATGATQGGTLAMEQMNCMNAGGIWNGTSCASSVNPPSSTAPIALPGMLR